MPQPKTQELQFVGAENAQRRARLILPADLPVGYALLAHCYACDPASEGLLHLSQALADRGWAVLQYDFAGTDFCSNVADVIAAAGYLKAHHAAPALLFGHSLAGTAVLRAAEQLEGVRAVATLNAPFDAEHARAGSARVFVPEGFLGEISRERMERAVGELGHPLLVLQATGDQVFPAENGQLIFDAAPHPKSFVAIDTGDHLLSRREDSVFAAGVLAAWASRYVPPVKKPSLEPLPEVGHVEVTEAGEGPYAQRITVGRHLLRADEPESFGGRDTGPSPYDLLNAAVGACTSMTLRMYASRKGWPLERVSVQLRHSKVHARDCKDCETTVGKIDQIERRIALEGPLDDAQRARLLEIADRCPVHRTLESEVKVRTELVERI